MKWGYFNNQFFPEIELYQKRKELKTLLYTYKFLHEKNKFILDSNYLNKLQDSIGWRNDLRVTLPFCKINILTTPISWIKNFSTSKNGLIHPING